MATKPNRGSANGLKRGLQHSSVDIEEIPVAVVVVEAASSRLVALNQRARGAFGMTDRRLVGAPLRALLGTGESASGEEALDKLLAGRAPHEVECTLSAPDGGSRVIRICAPARPDNRGRMVLTLLDRTREAEQLDGLIAAELRLMALIEATADAYYDWNIATDLNEFSLQMDRLLGLPPGGLPRTGDGWQKRVHPTDYPRVLRTLEAAIKGRVSFTVEYRMKRADGSYITVEDRARILTDDNGVPTNVVGTIRDVTRERAASQALRDSRRLYESLFRRASNPTLRIDGEGRIVDANAAALELLGLVRSDLGRRRVDDLIGDAAAGDSLVDVSPSATTTREVRVMTPAGNRYLLATIVPCRFEGREQHFVIGVDVTSLRDAQEALEASRVALEEQAQALTDRNTALRIVMEQHEEDRRTLEKRLSANVRELVLPSVDRLRKSLGSRPESVHLGVLEDAISRIAESSETGSASRLPPDVTLTRSEAEILNLVRLGRSSARIAEALVVSPATVSFHRRNLRRKLGLSPGTHLSTYLATQSVNVRPRREVSDAGVSPSRS